MTLRSFLVKRLVYTVVLIFFVIVLNWIIFLAIPGLQSGYGSLIASSHKVNGATYDRLNALYGLNQPIWVRFYDYVKAMLTFQWGVSYVSQQPVSTEMIQTGRLVNTLLLLGTSTVLSIIIGILLGVVVSRRRGSAMDSFWVTSSLASYSLPTFFLGIIFIMIFAIGLHWFPAGGTFPQAWFSAKPDIWTQIVVRLQYLFLPGLTLTLVSFGGFLLLTRATMMEVLSEDYILTARAKGLSERVILLRHAFKNASLPLITASALSIGFILGGAIITETVFNLQGLGFWLFSSIQAKDFPVMEAMFYIIALTVILANLVSDILYGIVDPRVRYE
jgi:peptide/nickel transport system permease protein